MSSSSRKQSNLHSFFAKKTTNTKENGTLNVPSSESPASSNVIAPAKPAASTTAASSSGEQKEEKSSVRDDATTTTPPPGDGTKSGDTAVTASTVSDSPESAKRKVDRSPLDEEVGDDDGDGDASTTTQLNKRKKIALQELRRTKRRVLEDDDDDDDEGPTQGGSNGNAGVEIECAVTTGAEKPSKTDAEIGGTKSAKSSDVPKSDPSSGPAADSETAGRARSRPASAKPPEAVPGNNRGKKEGEGATKSNLKKKEGTASASRPSPAGTSAAKAVSPSSVRIASPLAKALKVAPDEQLLLEARSSWAKEEVSTTNGGHHDLPYAVLCHTFSQIEAVTSRLQIQEILTGLFRTCLLLQIDLLPIVYLCCNEVAPAYKCVELGIGDAILVRAISEATGASPAAIKSQYEAQGDLGNVAQTAKGSQKTLGGFFKSKPAKGLTASHVLQVFQQIATTKGNQSQKWKTDSIKKLLVSADGKKEETRYIIRGLQGKLRIGLAESTVLISLAHAVALTVPEGARQPVDAAVADADLPEEARSYLDDTLPPEKRLEAAVAILKKAYSEVPSYEVLVKACMEAPLQDLHKACALTPGIPVAPMLAKPTKSVQEVLKRLNGQKFTCEYKYDGERAQVHLLPEGTTKVFSRNLLDTSEKYPEVPLFVMEAAVDVQSFVMDAEVVAFNNKTGQLVPFQVLSTRKKTEESAETAKVQVIVQAFDLMYLNGRSLLSSTLETRRSLLHQHFQAVPGKFQFATSMDHEENGDTTVIEEFLDGAVKGQCEGLMIKTLTTNANYEPSRRSLNWLKLKKDYLEGLGDSVDLVPLGAYFGRGKRTGVYGAYLLACYDPDTEEFQSVCKIGTGFSDEDLKSLAEKLNQHITPKKSSQYNTADQLECDVWFDAVQVWEVKAADLSKSSVHRCAEGKLEEGRGIGLRFPRFERVRDDKRPEDATTSDQILEMYYAQDSVADNGDTFDEGI